MAPYQVAFTRLANRDVDEKEAWLARLGSQTVARWRTRLLNAVERLERDPLCYPRIDEADELGLDLREIRSGSVGTSIASSFSWIETNPS